MALSPALPLVETDLYGPIRDYLVANGYAVQAEVKHCDVTARKGDDLIVVEMKLRCSLDLLIQALEFLHFLPVSGGDEAAEGGLQADRGEQIRLFRHFFAQ